MRALVAFTVGAHPDSVPVSVTNRKRAGAVVVPLVTMKSVVELLATMPVTSPVPFAPAGMFTTTVWTRPVPSYTVAVWSWLLLTHIGPPASTASAHGFFRCASVDAAATAPSDTRE